MEINDRSVVGKRTTGEEVIVVKAAAAAAVKTRRRPSDVYFGPHCQDGAKKMFSLRSRSACVSTISTPLAKLFSYYTVFVQM